jgi:uncharacterized membrane protein YsdA (DUF1294 family)
MFANNASPTQLFAAFAFCLGGTALSVFAGLFQEMVDRTYISTEEEVWTWALFGLGMLGVLSGVGILRHKAWGLIIFQMVTIIGMLLLSFLIYSIGWRDFISEPFFAGALMLGGYGSLLFLFIGLSSRRYFPWLQGTRSKLEAGILDVDELSKP